MEDDKFNVYLGKSTSVEIPKLELSDQLTSMEGYETDSDLLDAINIAIKLGQPLLVTGEPGTGKTQLAHSIAYNYNFNNGKALTFNTKSHSVAKDLFYIYDSVSHFRDIQDKDKKNINRNDYIHCQALGKAILLASQDEDVDKLIPDLSTKVKRPTRSIVLIDEIDKAPRDFPNDFLNEIEEMKFFVPELNRDFSAAKEYKPIVIITSNSEKNLPDAFLRRCIYFNIEPHSKDKLKTIIESRLGDENGQLGLYDQAIKHFLDIRKNMHLRKPPATHELIQWIKFIKERKTLDHVKWDEISEAQADFLATSYCILAKNDDDLKRLSSELHSS